jgi:hypothetical protein
MRLMGSIVALIVSVSAASAQDVPSKFSGAFPAGGSAQNVTGSLNGNKLTLKYLFRGQIPTTATYTCQNAQANYQTCSGTWRTDDGKGTGAGRVNVTWQGGQPLALSFQ